MNYETLDVRQSNSVLTIVLNRPNVLNAFSNEMLAELKRATDFARENSKIRAVLITGSGRAFCAGADLGDEVNRSLNPAKRAAQGAKSEHAMHEFFSPIVENIAKMQKPVVAAVNGVAAGGGMGLALSADLIIAAKSAYFTQVFVPSLGIVPDTGSTWFLPRSVGRAKAMGLMLLGEKMSAVDAEKLGMIWRCLDDDQLMPYGEEITHRLSRMPTYGIGLLKKAMEQTSQNSLTEQLNVEATLNNLGCSSADFVIGVNAFIDKEKPKFTGLYDGESD